MASNKGAAPKPHKATNYDIDAIYINAWDSAVRSLVGGWDAMDGDILAEKIGKEQHGEGGGPGPVPMWGTVFRLDMDARNVRGVSEDFGPPDPDGDDEAYGPILDWLAGGSVSASVIRCIHCGADIEGETDETGAVLWTTSDPKGGPFAPNVAHQSCSSNVDGGDGVEGPHAPDMTAVELFDDVREKFLDTDDGPLASAGWRALPGGAMVIDVDGESYIGVDMGGLSFYGDKGDGMPGRPGSVWGSLYAALGYHWHHETARAAVRETFAHAIETMTNTGDGTALLREVRAFKSAMGKLSKRLDRESRADAARKGE